ncbi:MAG: hypothetical protein HOO91_12675 [Bacteroidales bacterium]|nr:hypothetical protein [Bacteroidales bacterium]
MENKISITISKEAIEAINAAIATIEQQLPNLINLTVEDRKSLPKMGDKTLAFVSKALEYSKQNPKVVPPFLDVAEFEKDVQAVTNINKVLIPLQQLVEKLDDSTVLAGSEAYSSALIFYNAVKSAAKTGVPGMKGVYDDLQLRFAVKAKTNNVVPETK